MITICSVCGHKGKLIKENRACEALYSCSHCGKILLRVPLVSFEKVPLSVGVQA
ncbi:MAG: hypothetical protein AB9861_19180 [Methanosarcina sp.]